MVLKIKVLKYASLVLCVLGIMPLGTVFSAEMEHTRVVSIGGAITEIIYALGEESRIVAADATSIFPLETAGLKKVGYQRTLSAEGILAQRPSLLIATDAAGPSTVLNQVSSAGVAMEIIPNYHSFEGVVNKVKAVARVLGVPAKGEQLVASLTGQMKSIQEHVVVSVKPTSKIVFLLSVGQGPLMAAGHSTAANSIISLAGATNPFSQFEGYKPVSAESLLSSGPDIILVTKRTYEALGKDSILSIPGLRLTPAGKQEKIVVMDGLLLLGFSPRLPAAIRELHESI